ncbi:hypothetical protein [Actinosynnema sp. NPDC023587]|uniref:Fic family protein n=1 Tax=Actinosynnema sp. NPDC023587 TaxID=3154695 RepID=UPI0033E1B33E
MSHSPSPQGESVDPAGGGVDKVPVALRGLRAFTPAPLPVDVTLSTRAHADLASAALAVGRADEAAQRTPDRARFALCSQFREVQRSARMSGEGRSLLETFLIRLLMRRGAKVADESAREVLARYPLGRFILASEHCGRVLAGTPGVSLDVDLLGQGSGILTGRGHRSGSEGLRTRHGWLGGPDEARAHVLTMAPGEPLRAALAELSDWMTRPHPLSALGRIALVHLQLELLQPYPEANGHLARLFTSLAMVDSGMLRDQVLPLSPWMATHSDEYHLRIKAIVEGGAVEEWIRFFARGVREQAEEQLRLIAALEELLTRMLAKAEGAPATRRVVSPSTRRVVSGLITEPVMTNRALETRYGFSNRTAGEITRRLLSTGVLRVVQEKSWNRVFVCDEVLDLYTLRTPLEPASDADLFEPRPDER